MSPFLPLSLTYTHLGFSWSHHLLFTVVRVSVKLTCSVCNFDDFKSGKQFEAPGRSQRNAPCTFCELSPRWKCVEGDNFRLQTFCVETWREPWEQPHKPQWKSRRGSPSVVRRLSAWAGRDKPELRRGFVGITRRVFSFSWFIVLLLKHWKKPQVEVVVKGPRFCSY